MLINRQYVKGIVCLIGGIALTSVLGCLAIFPIWALSLADASCIARRLNRGEPVREWQWF